ncbi:MAG: hypothetical protein KJZ85_03120 [Rhodobacteraceae bacterium]|jgi:hypothetical protein|nr:hypothetical protein [Paracoccaceae bacterium]
MTSPHLVPDHARNMRILGHSDQGGRADGIQVMVSKGYAYVGHVFSNGFSVIDVRDPRRPVFVRHVPQPQGTWSQHLQTHGDLLIVNNMKDLLRDATLNPERYYRGSIADKLSLEGPQGYAAGMRVYDISDRANPREIAFMEVPGLGVHRVWYDGGDWAYISALPPGFTDDIFMAVDFRNPERPEPVSRLWLPGMHKAGGETPGWEPSRRYALHHAIVKGNLACGAWRDGGVTTIDVTDPRAPRLLAHDNPCPPFAGGTHNTLPLPGRGLMVVVEEAVFDNLGDGVKRNWVYDIREPANPVSIATMPIPDEADYARKGGQFGPHNIHENRSEGFQSEELVFISYQNAGLRAYDISDPFRPREVAACVPPAPARLMDYRPDRPRVVDTTDVYVDRDGLCYCTDMNAGLTIVELEGV